MFDHDQKNKIKLAKQKSFHLFCRFVIIYHDNIYIIILTLHYLIEKRIMTEMLKNFNNKLDFF